MKLSAPTTVLFVVSVVVAVLALLPVLGVAAVVPVSSFWLMAIAYAVLAIGCLFKGA
ncbi:MAG: hypothetical protein HKP56_01645 [Anderseniella sp.]|nr:hypothetical protein [Anderseniella sp.]